MQSLCTNHKTAKKQIGTNNAEKLAQRLDDLGAVSSLAEALKLPGKCHALTKDRVGQFAMSLADGVRLVFAPAMDPLPRREDQSLDLSKVTRIQTIFVGDYHD